MKITVHLSDRSILNAIRRLREAQDNIRWGLSDTIELLIKDGAIIANSNYGSMAEAIDWMEDETVGKISAVGDQPVIAEFGAGDATMEVRFENYPGVDVYPGSYSESDEGSGEYAATGKWHFGGHEYTEIEPRAGLLDAKLFIIDQAEFVAKGAIKL